MKRYLFVCVHNAGRSQMAEAFTNHYSRQHGLDAVASSAGTIGGSSLNPLAVRAMEEVGISMAGQAPKLLTQSMVGRDTKVVTMGCGVDTDACPARFTISEDWGLDDPAGKDMETVRAIRDQIESRVRAMLGIA